MNGIDSSQVLLYYRGWLYLFVTVLLWVVSFARFDKLARWHRMALRVFSLYFLCLACGGISSMFGWPEIGQFFITYGSTLFVTALAVCLSYYMIYRR